MTTTATSSSEHLQDQLGRRIAARLDQASADVPHDISERLRIARNLALSQRKVAKVQTAPGLVSMGNAAALQLGGGNFNMWNLVGSLLPLLALLVGLLVINVVQDDNRAREIAEVDVELLTDDLPPGAWTDPGFSEFLRSQHQL